MRKTKSIFYLLNLLIGLILLSGCGSNSVEDKMYGTWEISALFSNADFRKLSEEPIPDEVEIEMTVKGTQSYHKGGKYNGEGEITIRFKTAEGEIPLRFFMKDAGEWSLHDNGKELVETTTDGFLTPLDELTETFLKESPEMAASIRPVKGETTTSQILSISDTLMEIKDDELKIKITMSKMQNNE